MSEPMSPSTSFPGEDYARVALASIPRSLTLMDRNPASPTYGCFDRSWWLDRSTDFPNALAQYIVHGLAQAWARPYPDNPYYQNANVRCWTEAGLAFLLRQAHSDGSFDEFYPNERGWSGPSGFLLYALVSAYELLGVAPNSALGQEVRRVALQCAWMHLEHTEKGTLANHYAMAFLPVATTCRVLKEESLRAPLMRRFEDLLVLQNPEGWFREYDGPDAGYLSATVSFLAKMEKEGFQHSGLRPAVEKSLPFLSHFMWPDGTFGGAVASRQTVHIYPHGLEYFAKDYPLAAALAQAARRGVKAGGFVPPSVQSDHYYHYRINEYLEAAWEAKPLSASLPALPFEDKPFRRHFPQAGISVVRTADYYALVNLRKGGVLRAYDLASGQAAVLDSGPLVKLADGKVAASNWVDPEYQVQMEDDEVKSQGQLCRIPFKSFTPSSFLLFRLVMLVLGPTFAETLKGLFRNLLTLGVRRTSLKFQRTIRFGEKEIHWKDRLTFGSVKVKGLWIGAEIPLRYVPQSRHFQKYDLRFAPASPSEQVLAQAQDQGSLVIEQSITFPSLERRQEFQVHSSSTAHGA